MNVLPACDTENTYIFPRLTKFRPGIRPHTPPSPRGVVLGGSQYLIPDRRSATLCPWQLRHDKKLGSASPISRSTTFYPSQFPPQPKPHPPNTHSGKAAAPSPKMEPNSHTQANSHSKDDTALKPDRKSDNDHIPATDDATPTGQPPHDQIPPSTKYPKSTEPRQSAQLHQLHHASPISTIDRGQNGIRRICGRVPSTKPIHDPQNRVKFALIGVKGYPAMG